MENTERQMFFELKEFLTQNIKKYEQNLRHILYVHEGVKPGALLEELNLNRSQLKQFKNMLRWFNLYLSGRHNSYYVTKSRILYHRWNLPKFFSGRFLDKPKNAHRFLGFPMCCCAVYEFSTPYHLPGDLVGALQLYSLIRRARLGLISHKNAIKFSEELGIVHFSICRPDCPQAEEIYQKYLTVVRKYSWLITPPLITDYPLFAALQHLHYFLQEENKFIEDLRKHRTKFGIITTDEDIKEILIGGEDFRRTINYAQNLLKDLKTI